MFADEKGYLVTQMVSEEVTDDEQSPVSKKTDQFAENSRNFANSDKKDSNQEKANKLASATTNKKKTMPAVPAAGSQKSISSFFTKK